MASQARPSAGVPRAAAALVAAGLLTQPLQDDQPQWHEQLVNMDPHMVKAFRIPQDGEPPNEYFEDPRRALAIFKQLKGLCLDPHPFTRLLVGLCFRLDEYDNPTFANEPLRHVTTILCTMRLALKFIRLFEFGTRSTNREINHSYELITNSMNTMRLEAVNPNLWEFVWKIVLAHEPGKMPDFPLRDTLKGFTAQLKIQWEAKAARNQCMENQLRRALETPPDSPRLSTTAEVDPENVAPFEDPFILESIQQATRMNDLINQLDIPNSEQKATCRTDIVQLLDKQPGEYGEEQSTKGMGDCITVLVALRDILGLVNYCASGRRLSHDNELFKTCMHGITAVGERNVPLPVWDNMYAIVMRCARAKTPHWFARALSNFRAKLKRSNEANVSKEDFLEWQNRERLWQFKRRHNPDWASTEYSYDTSYQGVIRDGFKSEQELVDWALEKHAGRMPEEKIRAQAHNAWKYCEVGYPSVEEMERRRVKAAALARKATKHYTDEDIFNWCAINFENPKGAPISEITTRHHRDTMDPAVLAKKVLIPTKMTHMAEPWTMVVHDRHAKYVLPNGTVVPFPISEAYLDVIRRRRNRELLARKERKDRADAAARTKAQRIREKEEAKQRAIAERLRRRWQRAIRLVMKQNRMFAIANAEHAAEAERRRAIRSEAELVAASREPRAYSTPGSSHPERAPTWAALEAPSAADKAKKTVAKEVAKEARIAAIEAKKRAEEEAAAHRLWQFEQLRTAEAIGGRH